MKVILNILTVFLAGILTILLSSCTDSLGIESNVNKIAIFDSTFKDTTKKDTTNKDTTKKDTVVDPVKARIHTNDIQLTMEETIIRWDKDLDDTVAHIPWNIKINAKQATIDTSGINTRIWLTLDFENVYDIDTLGYKLITHSQAIQFRMDSIRATGFYWLNGEMSSRLWSALFMEYFPSKKIYVFSGMYSPLQFQFLEDYRNKSNGRIRGLLSASFVVDNPNDKMKKQKINLSSIITIKY